MIAGLNYSPNLDPYAAISNGVNWAQAQIASAGASSVKTEGPPEVSAVTAPASSVEARSRTVPVAAKETPVPGDPVTLPAAAALTEPAKKSAESPISVSAKAEQPSSTATDTEEDLKALFPVAAPVTPVVEPGIYVQHASFRLPQSALIWKKQQSIARRQSRQQGERFVTVSGPFIDRGQAVQYLQNLVSLRAVLC